MSDQSYTTLLRFNVPERERNRFTKDDIERMSKPEDAYFKLKYKVWNTLESFMGEEGLQAEYGMYDTHSVYEDLVEIACEYGASLLKVERAKTD